jgi:DNA repair photolyase
LKSMYKIYKTKHILNIHKHIDGGWFWVKYSADPYIGCEHGCQYCYSRDEKYNPHKSERDPDVLKFDDAFSEYIKIKEHAPELLMRALRGRPIDLIYIDGYQPVEAKYRYARGMLEVCLALGFPVFINEKSPLLLQDLDILKAISRKSHLNVGWSIITTTDDTARQILESKAPPTESRFKAMKELADNGITTGTVFMPILPFIYDTDENIESVVRKTKESGGIYVLDAGLTLWGYCKTHFYKALEKLNPDLIPKYDKLFEDQTLLGEHQVRVHKKVLEFCQKYDLSNYIPRPIDYYPEELRLNKEIAAKFYLEARELLVTGQRGYKEWAFRKAAWTLDDLKESVKKIYEEKGIHGLMQIEGIGQKLATRIEGFL